MENSSGPLDPHSISSRHVRQIFCSPWFVVNAIVGWLITFGINVGIAFWAMHGHAYIGVWEEPTYNMDGRYIGSSVFLDAFLALFFTAFFGCLANGALLPREVAQGKIPPLRPCVRHQRKFLWLCPGVSIDGLWKRSLVFAIQTTAITLFTGLLLLVLGDVHSIAQSQWCFGKGAWCAMAGLLQYPFVIVASVDVDRLEMSTLESYRANAPKTGLLTDSPKSAYGAAQV